MEYSLAVLEVPRRRILPEAWKYTGNLYELLREAGDILYSYQPLVITFAVGYPTGAIFFVDCEHYKHLKEFEELKYTEFQEVLFLEGVKRKLTNLNEVEQWINEITNGQYIMITDDYDEADYYTFFNFYMKTKTSELEFSYITYIPDETEEMIPQDAIGILTDDDVKIICKEELERMTIDQFHCKILEILEEEE